LSELEEANGSKKTENQIEAKPKISISRFGSLPTISKRYLSFWKNYESPVLKKKSLSN
jgi:hypothetical protein